MLRDVVVIDENKCNGCGECVPGCPEGALQIIDGKARLVSDLLCDGLGACIGECPVDAITVEKKEAEAYDERKVMENVIKQGENTIKAHLKHLQDHGETEFLQIALDYLKENNLAVPDLSEKHSHGHGGGGCPGSRMLNFSDDSKEQSERSGDVSSQLRQWPVQMHLISPRAPYFQNADVVLAADCVAFSMGNFHNDYLKGKALAIACPKLDSDMHIYEEKITSMIDDSNINTLTVMIMEVPCCGGLAQLAKQAAAKAKRKVPIKLVLVGLKGNVLREEWV